MNSHSFPGPNRLCLPPAGGRRPLAGRYRGSFARFAAFAVNLR